METDSIIDLDFDCSYVSPTAYKYLIDRGGLVPAIITPGGV